LKQVNKIVNQTFIIILKSIIDSCNNSSENMTASGFNYDIYVYI